MVGLPPFTVIASPDMPSGSRNDRAMRQVTPSGTSFSELHDSHAGGGGRASSDDG